MFTNTQRVFNFALTDFWRNRGISISAIFVLTVTTILVTGLFFVHGVSDFLVGQVQSKIDVTAYFKTDAAEADILDAKAHIEKLSPQIQQVEYVSKEQALENFTALHQDNDVFSRALTEVGENPFLPSLNITTSGGPQLYQQVADVMQSNQFAPIVDHVDFAQKKETIEKVFSVTSAVTTFGLALSVLFIVIAILVIFNTMKLAIGNSRDEIMTMNIVGAPNWFVRMPFVIEGALFGAVSFVICFILTIIASFFLKDFIRQLLPGFSLLKFFIYNVFIIILVQLATGAGLGALCSFIAVRKYLKPR